jgi:hypothetical protein
MDARTGRLGRRVTIDEAAFFARRWMAEREK